MTGWAGVLHVPVSCWFHLPNDRDLKGCMFFGINKIYSMMRTTFAKQFFFPPWQGAVLHLKHLAHTKNFFGFFPEQFALLCAFPVDDTKIKVPLSPHWFVPFWQIVFSSTIWSMRLGFTLGHSLFEDLVKDAHKVRQKYWRSKVHTAPHDIGKIHSQSKKKSSMVVIGSCDEDLGWTRLQDVNCWVFFLSFGTFMFLRSETSAPGIGV